MIGQQVLLYFAILLFIVYATVYFGVRRKQERMFAVMACGWVIIIDQYVKRAVVQSLALGETAELLPGLLRLERVHNYGAAWSSFSGARWLLVGVTAAALAALYYLAPPAGGLVAVAGHRRRHRQPHRPRDERLCGGYAGDGVHELPRVQRGGHLRHLRHRRGCNILFKIL